MAKSSAEIMYDESEDILSFWRGRPSKASIEIGDFIVDIDSQGYVSGLEIINASENLGINIGMLKKIEKAKMAVIYKPNYLFIIVSVNFKGIEKDIRIPLTIDLGHKRVEKQEVVFAR